jgi:glycogen operon protein
MKALHLDLRWSFSVAFAATLMACVIRPAFAGTIGTNHPASGAYSPVNPSGWGTAGWPLGPTFTGGSGSTLEVGVYSANATRVVLEVYLSDTGADAAYDYTMSKGTDNIWRAAIAQAPANTLYAFRAWGPNWAFDPSWTRGNSTVGFVKDCDASGNRFNPNKVLFDPYARELSHNRDTPAMLLAGETGAMYGTGGTDIDPSETYSGPITGNVSISRRNVDTGHWAPKAVAVIDSTPTGPRPNLNQQDAIIYETHLKGLTAHPTSVNLTSLLSSYSGFQDAANVPDSLRGTYAGAAYMAGYLKDLGINTVEFLPLHETNNATSSTTSSSGANYWAYWTYGFFAPDRRYASNQSLGGPTAEFKSMVAAFHNAGIEVYLDVVYNHTGEGGTWDTSGAAAELTFLRGLDNRSYYTLVGAANQYYNNNSGVGEDLNGGSSPVQNLVLDSLAYWNQTMGVDGFRFDLAVELGRNGTSGFSSTSPLLTAIASLANTNHFKIVAEPWDNGDGNEIGNFPAGWAAWNGNFRDAVRSIMLGSFAGKNGTGYADGFYGSYNQMNGEGGPQKSINLLDAHDGFTMADLVSFNSQDQNSLAWPFGPGDGGTNDNRSSDWGNNQVMRRQVIRTLWTFGVLSRGVPMVVWGDEFGRPVNGNNNAYNVDSVATWNNYGMIASNAPNTVATGDITGGAMAYDNELGTFASPNNGNFAFLQYLLQLRAAHQAFRQTNYNEAITYTNPDGSSGFNEWTSLTPRIYISGSQVQDEDFLFLCNFSGSSITYNIPSPPTGTRWVRLIDTNNWAENVANCWPVSSATTITGTYGVGNQSAVLLEAVAITLYAHTITFDGTIGSGEYATSESFGTSSSSTGYNTKVTWDANYIYIAYAGSDVSATVDATNTLLVVYVGDAGHPLQGTKSGVKYGNISYTLPFNAVYAINWQSDWNNFNNAKWTGGSWSWTSPLAMSEASGSNPNQLARNWGNATLEMRIPRAALGTNKVNLLWHFVNKDSSGQWTYGMAPAGAGTDGASSNVAFKTFYTLDLTENVAPVAQNPGM